MIVNVDLVAVVVVVLAGMIAVTVTEVTVDVTVPIGFSIFTKGTAFSPKAQSCQKRLSTPFSTVPLLALERWRETIPSKFRSARVAVSFILGTESL